MSHTPGAMLKDVLGRHGREVLDDQKRFEAILKDKTLPKAQSAALASTLKEKIPQRLLVMPAAGLTDTMVVNLGSEVSHNTGLDGDIARWAIEAWVDGLDLRIQDSEREKKDEPDSVQKDGAEVELRLEKVEGSAAGVEALTESLVATTHSPIPERSDVLFIPFGPGRILERIYEGRRHSIFRVEIGGRELCVKTLSRSPEDLYRCSAHRHDTSETFCWAANEIWEMGAATGKDANPLLIRTQMLLIENELIRSNGPKWNHSVIGLGVWDHHVHEEARDRFPPQGRRLDPEIATPYPMILMPYYDSAIPLSRLPREEQRQLFPRLLPALFTALAHHYHGDFSESNILIERDASLFRLIDPGVIISSRISWREGHFGLRQYDEVSFFTTTPENYPLLPPFKPPAEVPADPVSNSLLAHLKSIEEFNGGLRDLFTIMGSEVHAFVGPGPRPWPSDLLALGLVYYRILTGENLFLDTRTGLDRPLWLEEPPGFYWRPWISEGRATEACRRIITLIEAGYIDEQLDRSEITSRERRAAKALINLQVQDRQQLIELL